MTEKLNSARVTENILDFKYLFKMTATDLQQEYPMGIKLLKFLLSTPVSEAICESWGSVITNIMTKHPAASDQMCIRDRVSITEFFPMAAVEYASTFTFFITFILRYILCPVSYTHLDVYKRQIPGRSTVWLEYKLKRDLPNNISNLLKSYISGRYFRGKHEDCYSELKQITTGLP